MNFSVRTLTPYSNNNPWACDFNGIMFHGPSITIFSKQFLFTVRSWIQTFPAHDRFEWVPWRSGAWYSVVSHRMLCAKFNAKTIFPITSLFARSSQIIPNWHHANFYSHWSDLRRNLDIKRKPTLFFTNVFFFSALLFRLRSSSLLTALYWPVSRCALGRA